MLIRVHAVDFRRNRDETAGWMRRVQMPGTSWDDDRTCGRLYNSDCAVHFASLFYLFYSTGTQCFTVKLPGRGYDLYTAPALGQGVFFPGQLYITTFQSPVL
jgi:hypothetical protein